MVSAARLTAFTLRRVAGGRLAALPFDVAFWDGSTLPAGGPSVGTVRVRRPAVGHLLHEPNQLGLVRAFVSGDLDLDGDLVALLRERGRFRGTGLSKADLGVALAAALALGGRDAVRRPAIPAIEHRPHGGLRHSLHRDRHTVRHHYDASNAFYRHLLGPSMVYSCAYFEDPADALEAAQDRKLELICRKLRLQPGERLLDIGCGWGSLLVHAAERFGVRAVGVTLSQEQATLARARVREAGLADRVEIRVADYREVHDGPYDKVASVGMVEHVGVANLPAYAATIARLLRPGGLALNHGIAQLFSEPAGSKGLIQRYVFPDGELPALGTVVGALQGAGLEPRDVESLREHYALTLWAWIANLREHRDAIVAEVGEPRERAWLLYLIGSALAFEDADISIFQVLAARPGAGHELPLQRGDVLAAEAV
jgi:cyclopropane-fatty-acyl-phospholipid synthase